MYSAFTLTWIIVNDCQVEFFSFNHRKQWKLSVCKNDINQVRVNGLYLTFIVSKYVSFRNARVTEVYLLLTVCLKQLKPEKDNDNIPSTTAMNFEISVHIGSVYRQLKIRIPGRIPYLSL